MSISLPWECSAMQNFIREAVAQLIADATNARALSGTFSEAQTVCDLEHFATALERDADALMLETGELKPPVRKAGAKGSFQ